MTALLAAYPEAAKEKDEVRPHRPPTPPHSGAASRACVSALTRPSPRCAAYDAAAAPCRQASGGGGGGGGTAGGVPGGGQGEKRGERPCGAPPPLPSFAPRGPLFATLRIHLATATVAIGCATSAAHSRARGLTPRLTIVCRAESCLYSTPRRIRRRMRC